MATLASGFMLLFVTALGVAIGTVLRNMIAAVVVIMVVFAAQGLIFDFLNVEYLSSTAVLDLLHAMIRGELGDWQQARILLAFGGGTAALAAIAGIVFNEREF